MVFFFSVSSFYFPYLVSFLASVFVQTWKKLKRCSDKKVITFNIQYITASWMDSFIFFHTFTFENNIHIFGSIVNLCDAQIL